MKKSDEVNLSNALTNARRELTLLIEVQQGVQFEVLPGRATNGTDYLRAEGVLSMLQAVRRELNDAATIMGESV
jgi:hypothetical protein